MKIFVMFSKIQNMIRSHLHYLNLVSSAFNTLANKFANGTQIYMMSQLEAENGTSNLCIQGIKC